MTGTDPVAGNEGRGEIHSAMGSPHGSFAGLLGQVSAWQVEIQRYYGNPWRTTGCQTALTRGVRTLARREFWSFKVIHALIGGLLTVTGACGGIFITEQIKKQISGVDSQMSEVTQRIDSIERALSQFQVLQAQGVLLGALSAGDGMREDCAARSSMDFCAQRPDQREHDPGAQRTTRGFRREREA